MHSSRFLKIEASNLVHLLLFVLEWSHEHPNSKVFTFFLKTYAIMHIMLNLGLQSQIFFLKNSI